MRFKAWSLLLCLLAVLPLSAQRARRLDPMTDIVVSFRKGALVVEAPEGAHLKCAFMEVKLQKGAPGTLKVGPLPPANGKDELDEGIWRGPVIIPVKGEGLAGEVPLSITYQPCTEGTGGVCYPPTDRVLKVKASEIPPIAKPEKPKEAKSAVEASISEPLPAIAAAPVAPDTQAPVAPARNLFWIFLSVFAAGLLASLTPCVFPMIPITMAIIGAKGSGKGKGLALSATLVAGMATTYTVLGVAAARAGAAFGASAQKPAFLIPVALLFAVFAVSLFGAFEIQLPEALRSKLQGSGPRRGFLGAFIMGLVLGPLSAPCVGPVIGTVLLAIAKEGRVLLGALQLFTFALGMGVLFMIAGSFSAALPRSGNWLVKLKQAMGVIVLAFAAWSVRLVVPAWLNPAMWSLVLLTAAATLEAFKPAEGLGPSLRKGFGLLALVLAILLGLRAVESALKLELLPRSGTITASAPAEKLWMEQDLEGALARAKSEKKLVLVDTYAEWCAQCKDLDEKTWPDAKVAAWIRANAVPVRIDADKVRPDIAERFKIAGYPTILMLDAEGKEQRRFMGFQEPKEMLAFLAGRS